MSSTRLKASRSADRSMSWALFPLLMPMFLRRSPMHTRGKSRRASIASCDETLDPCLHVSIASGSRTTPCLSCPIFSVLGSLHAALKFDDHWVQNRISEEQAASLVHSLLAQGCRSLIDSTYQDWSRMELTLRIINRDSRAISQQIKLSSIASISLKKLQALGLWRKRLE